MQPEIKTFLIPLSQEPAPQKERISVQVPVEIGIVANVHGRLDENGQRLGEDRIAEVHGDGFAAVIHADGASNCEINGKNYEEYGGDMASLMVTLVQKQLAEQLKPGLSLQEVMTITKQTIRLAVETAKKNLLNVREFLYRKEFDSTMRESDFPVNAFPGNCTLMFGMYYKTATGGAHWITSGVGDGWIILSGHNKEAQGISLRDNQLARDNIQIMSDEASLFQIQNRPAEQGDRLIITSDGADHLWSPLLRRKYPGQTINSVFKDWISKKQTLVETFRSLKHPVVGDQMFTSSPSSDDLAVGGIVAP